MPADEVDRRLREVEKRLAGRPDDEVFPLTVGETRALLRKLYQALALAESARAIAESALGHHEG